MRSPLNVSKAVDYAAMKVNAFKDHGILIINLDQDKLPWQERELLEQIGTRLYGERRPKG